MQFFRKKDDHLNREVEKIDPIATSRLQVLAEESHLCLCKDKNHYHTILKYDVDNHFVLCRTSTESLAKKNFQCLCKCLGLNLDVFGKECMNVECLQRLVDAVEQNDKYTLAHLAVATRLTSLFRKEAVKCLINEADEKMKRTPLFLAVKLECIEMVKTLLENGASLEPCDVNEDCILHVAARCSNPEIIRILGNKDKSKINLVNKKGLTPMHEACLKDSSDNVAELLKLGGSPCLSSLFHFAIKNDCLRALEMLCSSRRGQKIENEEGVQEEPLHAVKSREAMRLFLKFGADLEKKNSRGETVLMKKVRVSSHGEALTCLYKGASIETRDAEDCTPLMTAVANDDYNMVKLLLTFGADVNSRCNYNGRLITPRHRAAISNSKNKECIVSMLHTMGAERCEVDQKDCNSLCSNKGSNNGKYTKSNEAFNVTEDELNADALRAIWNYAENEVLKMAEERCSETDETPKKQPAGNRVLTLNAGRLEGLLIIRFLIYLEEVCGKRVKDCFDFIGGCGSGAFIALAIMQDIPLRKIFNHYLEICHEVLYNKNAPCTEREFESRLKNIFGENKKLSDCTGPNLVTTACRSDDRPLKKVLCRNYEIPSASSSNKKKVDHYIKPSDVLCWRAAKWSGFAEAGLYSSSKTFLDACMVSSDACMDTLLEVHQIDCANAMNYKEVKPLHIVVSLGGECSLAEVKSSLNNYELEKMDVEERKNYIGRLLLEYSGHLDSYTARQAEAWCHMTGSPLIRFHPFIPNAPSTQEIINDPISMISFLWDAQRYVVEQEKRFRRVAQLIR